ncbi:hypothetical protein, partial [Kineococcus glutinatus]|uniref:hypothetical protein n=1 Tax=Kineococcus glutinatus TaxID=1070872 RepID=UPI0031F00F9D
IAADAERAAAGFAQAAAAADGPAMCDLMVPGTAEDLVGDEGVPCAQAATALDLPAPADPGPAQVWGDSALVAAGAASVFLARVDGVWLVRAAGCELRDGEPADCVLEGG